jgi:tetratricopeptide (TPR) repeat protein
MTSTGDFDEVRLMIEVVHHACAAGDLDAAAAVLYNRVYRGPNAYLTGVLGGYEMALDTLTDFYPFRDLSLDPRLEDPAARRWILHETAACLHVLGRLTVASELGGRAAAAAIAAGDRHNAAISYHNLAESRLAAGALASCRAVATEALHLAVEAGEMEDELVACTILGRLDDLAERHDRAAEKFERALEIAVSYTSVPLLYSLSGVRYAEHLAASGREEEAASAIVANLEFCRAQGWQSDVAFALAQSASMAPMSPEASAQADEAVRISRTIGAKQTLAETLLARAMLALRTDALDAARADLAEVLTHALPAGYRLLEADARTMMATVRQAQGEPIAAMAEAELAKQLSREIAYEHGYRQANDVIARIRQS